jgi:putative heme iron utilization protein
MFSSGLKHLEFKHPVFEVIYVKRIFMGSILYSVQFVTRNGPVLFGPTQHYKLLSVP